jgi:hypothetical protein
MPGRYLSQFRMRSATAKIFARWVSALARTPNAAQAFTASLSCVNGSSQKARTSPESAANDIGQHDRANSIDHSRSVGRDRQRFMAHPAISPRVRISIAIDQWWTRSAVGNKWRPLPCPHYRNRMGHDYDASVSIFLSQRVTPGAICFDVGANVGVYVYSLRIGREARGAWLLLSQIPPLLKSFSHIV